MGSVEGMAVLLLTSVKGGLQYNRIVEEDLMSTLLNQFGSFIISDEKG